MAKNGSRAGRASVSIQPRFLRRSDVNKHSRNWWKRRASSTNYFAMNKSGAVTRCLREKLAADTSPLGKARLEYFDFNKGPWSDLDEHASFLPAAAFPEVPARKPLGANFYPKDMTKEEFEQWPGKDIGFFSLIHRQCRSIARRSLQP